MELMVEVLPSLTLRAPRNLMIVVVAVADTVDEEGFMLSGFPRL